MKRSSLLPRVTFGEGTDPDPRYTLANERTFLAWVRTALALMACGVAIETFTADLLSPLLRSTMAASLLILAAAISGCACLRWLAVERALRRKESLPLPLQVPIVSVTLALVSLVFMAILHY
ncbi:membrane protein [Halomonas cupida]|uniref:Membrane protein n=1 Tax=Halomonas cupida TaxID=44933 RepID=A0ABQ0WBJ3_9GAMM|nr:membrane protein [Halomonas cupida]